MHTRTRGTRSLASTKGILVPGNVCDSSPCSSRDGRSKPNTHAYTYTHTVTHVKGPRLGLMFKAIVCRLLLNAGKNSDSRHLRSLFRVLVIMFFSPSPVRSVGLSPEAECGKQRTFFVLFKGCERSAGPLKRQGTAVPKCLASKSYLQKKRKRRKERREKRRAGKQAVERTTLH